MTDTLMPPIDRDQVLEQAAEWIVRAEDVEFSPEEAEQLEQWLECAPEHAAAYHELEALWGKIPQLPGAAAQWPLAANDDAPAGPPIDRPWLLIGGLAVSAAAAAAVVLLVPLGGEPNVQRIKTNVAQISEIALEDGSIATLGPRTEVLVAFSDGERRLRLEHGEAFFDVSKDPERPFVVETDRSSVRVTGTRFNVKDGRDVLQVAVLEGSVQLLNRNILLSKASPRVLVPGNVAQVTGTLGRSRVRISHTSDVERLDRLAAGWREGWLAYEDAALVQIVEDLNRYYSPGVKLVDPAVGETRVTAAFRASNVTQFLDTLDALFPVLVEKGADGRYLLSRAARAYPAP